MGTWYLFPAVVCVQLVELGRFVVDAVVGAMCPPNGLIISVCSRVASSIAAEVVAWLSCPCVGVAVSILEMTCCCPSVAGMAVPVLCVIA